MTLALTLNGTPVLIGFALVALWLIALTASHVRAGRHRGEPVFRRLPDGRIRFEWSVGTAYHAARRSAARPQSGPDPAVRPPIRPGPDHPRR